MKRFSALLCLVLCLALPLVLTACASSSTSESTGQFVDDSVITTKVKAQLAGDKITSLLVITVETYKGVVQLSGFVDNGEQKDEAGMVAKNVNGVVEVKNNLIIKGK